MHQYTIFDEENDEEIGAPVDAPAEVHEAWRKAKQTMKQTFTRLQEMPYEDEGCRLHQEHQMDPSGMVRASDMRQKASLQTSEEDGSGTAR